nr:MAG TPA: hypothetical protein [Caudoviricetes sp.]DAK04731.1 MAG TPA: hypothetical protein [Caudoviricetes sp.]DAL06162.1 MAG TPA: hypothetical protein [Caudoviricetes sp.]DAL90862.1 MAG TPA: hypothetical protein [Caudoviricetes sp.]DAM18387.1 MAG TPA: hypothetical protein [Caudoviricetes sp.]
MELGIATVTYKSMMRINPVMSKTKATKRSLCS